MEFIKISGGLIESFMHGFYKEDYLSLIVSNNTYDGGQYTRSEH